VSLTSVRGESLSLLVQTIREQAIACDLQTAEPCCWKECDRSTLSRRTRTSVQPNRQTRQLWEAQSLRPGLRPTSTRLGFSCRIGLSFIRVG